MQTRRLQLREREPEIMRRLLHAKPEEQERFFGTSDNEKLATELERIENGQYENMYAGIYFDILLKKDYRVIGSAGYHTWWRKHDRAEIGYWLTEEADRGKGYMNEILPILLDYGFTKMKLHRIEAFTSMDNEASMQLLQKYGFKKEATINGRYKMPDGSYEDDYLFYLLRS